MSIRKRNQLVKQLVLKGISGNRIGKELRKQGYKIGRQRLQAEIRNIKGVSKKTDSVKYTPKKYRKRKPKQITLVAPQEQEEIFRLNYIINDVPVHSKPFKRNYLGFRITAYSTSKSFLQNNRGRIKRLLLKETDKYLGAPIQDWNMFAFDIVGGALDVLYVPNPKALDKRYMFRIEREGKDLKVKNGFL